MNGIRVIGFTCFYGAIRASEHSEGGKSVGEARGKIVVQSGDSHLLSTIPELPPHEASAPHDPPAGERSSGGRVGGLDGGETLEGVFLYW